MCSENGNFCCFAETGWIVLSRERILIKFKHCVWSAQLSSTLVLAIWDLRQSCSAANFRNPNAAATQKFLAAVCPRMHSGGKIGLYILVPIRVLTINKLKKSRKIIFSGQLFVENIPLRISYLNWNFWSTKLMNIVYKRNVLELIWCKKC